MLKKGSIPVVLLVILTLVLISFAVIVIVLAAGRVNVDLEKGYESVQEFNIGVKNSGFLGSGEIEIVRKTHKRYGFLGIGFGGDVLDVEIRKR